VTAESAVRVRPMVEDDVDAADRITRVAFGTFRGLADPSATFGDAEGVRTRFRAAPDCAWVAEAGGDVVGSVFAARWGTFGFFGPLAVHPDWWDRGVGSRLLEPVLAAFEHWQVRQAGLFTFSSSPKHLGLYQKHGFWPGYLTAVLAKPVATTATAQYMLFSRDVDAHGPELVDQMRGLTDAVFTGLDLEREILAVWTQGLGDTVLVQADGRLVGMAVCHLGAGSEAGSGVCYVKFAAARPGADAAHSYERLLDACEAFAVRSGAERLVAGVSTGRLDAYRRLLGRGFRADLLGVAMHLRPDQPHLDTPAHYVLDDLR
jgi:predicted N-acetyltransferase YhbS